MSIKEEVVNTAVEVASFDELRVVILLAAILISGILGTIQYFLNRKHQKNTYIINRHNNTQSILRQSTVGEIRNVYNELKTDLRNIGMEDALWDESKTMADVLAIKTEGAPKIGKESLDSVIFRIKNNTYNLLNFYDCIGTSIRADLLDSEMIFNHYSLMIMDAYRWAKPLMDEQKGAFRPWKPFEQMAKAYIKHQDLLKAELDSQRDGMFMKEVVKIK